MIRRKWAERAGNGAAEGLRAVRVQEAVGSNPATPTKILRFLCRKHKNLRISSFAKPVYLCDTPKPRSTEKADHSTDYLAEMLTRR